MTTKRLRKALPIQRDFEKMTIKLEQVIEAIEMSDDFFTSFWDTKTGETVYPADPLLNGETDEVLAAEIEKTQNAFFDFRPSTRYTDTASWRTLLNSFLPERCKAIFLIAFGEKVLFAGSRSLYAITV